jgi:hypothetical protein
LWKMRKLIWKKIFVYLVKKEKINWKSKPIFTLWKKRILIGKINLSILCQKRRKKLEK